MLDLPTGQRRFLYEVSKNGFRYITSDTPDGSEFSATRYVRADIADADRDAAWNAAVDAAKSLVEKELGLTADFIITLRSKKNLV